MIVIGWTMAEDLGPEVSDVERKDRARPHRTVAARRRPHPALAAQRHPANISEPSSEVRVFTMKFDPLIEAADLRQCRGADGEIAA
jgi:hypothetical protein